MQNNRGKQKRQQNFFEQNIEQSLRQNGDDNFILRMDPGQIQKFAKKRIFREMAYNQIDYEACSKYFLDPKFFENLLQAAYDELNNNIILARALAEYDLNHPGNNLIGILRAKYTNLEYIYTILYDRLLCVKQSGFNLGYLSDISAVLLPYRNQI